MSGVRVTGFFKSIEKWASESEERSRLLVILIWIAFGVLVLLATLAAAAIMLPPSARPF